jgi:DNA repair photolyase
VQDQALPKSSSLLTVTSNSLLTKLVLIGTNASNLDALNPRSNLQRNVSIAAENATVARNLNPIRNCSTPIPSNK